MVMWMGKKDYSFTPFSEKFSGISVAVQCGKQFSVSRPEGKKNCQSQKSIPFLVNFYYHLENQVGFDNVPLASVNIKIFWFFSITS